MTRIKGLLLLGISLFIVHSESFSQTKDLSLKEAINLSLQNNKALKSSNEKVNAAIAKVTEMRNNKLPEISVSGSYIRLNSPNIDLKIPLKSGSPGADTTSHSSSPIDLKQAAYGIANVTLPLFSGFKIQYGIKSAEFLQKAAELDRDQNKESLIENTIEAYYNLFKAQKAVDLVNENLNHAHQRSIDFGNLEKNGLLARNDLLKVQLQESNIELTLLEAQNNLKISNFNMDLMLGLDEKTELELTSDPQSVIKNDTEIGSLPEMESKALNNRSDYLALQQQQQAGEIGIKAAKSNYYPSVALTGGYIALYAPNVITVTNAINVGIGLKYNISNLYKSGAKIKEAQAQERQIYFAMQQMNDGIRVQIHKAYQDYLVSLQKIKVYQKAVVQAEENYNVVNNKYKNSLATTTDLLDADVAKLQADLNAQYANADAITAYYKLFETTGTLSQINSENK